ncbi:MAG: hypothetical protein ACI9JR_002267, partial [Gammaproteobacteria bacterium]
PRLWFQQFLLLQNRHTGLHVHKLRAGAPARLILMYFTYTADFCAGFFALTKKSLFLEAP